MSKETKKHKKNEEPCTIWGMGNITPSGMCFSFYVPKHELRSENFDLLEIKKAVNWLTEVFENQQLSAEEYVKLTTSLINQAKRFAK